MKWIYAVYVFCAIQNAFAVPQIQRQSIRNQKKINHKTQRILINKNIVQNFPTKYNQVEQKLTNTVQPPLEPEVDMLRCPPGCVCQYGHFMDLPISRWINFMQRRSTVENAEILQNDLINNNEVAYDGDESFLTNPYLKQATCLIQGDTDIQKLVHSLPHDLQALILLYTGIGQNKTMNLSTLKPLNQLATLEIRGAQDRTFRLIFDEPLTFIQHVNFEAITMLGSETFKRPKNPVHPSESFDYKPRSEMLEANINEKLDFVLQDEDDTDEILPYDIYIEEVRKARMPTFYGWEHLEVLRIHSCQLAELQWEMFDGLETLQHLSLERNAIREIPAFSLYGAMHIKTLSLAHNHIHDLHYRSLAGLLELEVLDLSDNRLSKLSERSFPPFPKLERVDFRNNPIKFILPASFWVMNATRTMFFGSKELALELWSNQPFESLHELRELTLGNVTIGSLEQNVFKVLLSLEKLTIRGSIRSIEFDAFAGLQELRTLDLSNCQIREISMDSFIGCHKLRLLNLAYNNISYLPPGIFDDQKELEEIYLQGNQLRTLPLDFFLKPKLHLAHLHDNPWKCSCDMSNWLPKVTNLQRGPSIERCITDFKTGKQLSCRRVDNYIFDHRFAPRCANYNERSVFYVLRKQLRCGGGRVIHTKHRKIPLKTDEHSKTQHSNPTTNRMTWQLRKEQKIRRTMAQKNTLDHILQSERRLLAEQTRYVKSRTNTNDYDEMSNEV